MDAKTTTVIVSAELEAARLLWPSYGSTESGTEDIHEAGNRIIALAERIKAERAVAAMQER